MKANVQESKLFAIQDSQGKYVDENTIWYEKETSKWHYTPQDDYRSGCVWLNNSIKQANKKIEGLESLLCKVNLQKTFTIVPISTDYD